MIWRLPGFSNSRKLLPLPGTKNKVRRDSISRASWELELWKRGQLDRAVVTDTARTWCRSRRGTREKLPQSLLLPSDLLLDLKRSQRTKKPMDCRPQRSCPRGHKARWRRAKTTYSGSAGMAGGWRSDKQISQQSGLSYFPLSSLSDIYRQWKAWPRRLESTVPTFVWEVKYYFPGKSTNLPTIAPLSRSKHNTNWCLRQLFHKEFMPHGHLLLILRQELEAWLTWVYGWGCKMVRGVDCSQEVSVQTQFHFSLAMCPRESLRFSICEMKQWHRTNSRAARDWRDRSVPWEQPKALRDEEKPLFIPAGTFPATVARADETNPRPGAKNLVSCWDSWGVKKMNGAIWPTKLLKFHFSVWINIIEYQLYARDYARKLSTQRCHR